MKNILCTIAVVLRSVIASLFGGWDTGIGTFVANELISIVENAGLMGLPPPAILSKVIDILTKKAEVTK